MISASTAAHKEIAARQGAIPIAVITVSDSRTPGTDTNGHYLSEQIERAGHRVAFYRIIKDEPLSRRNSAGTSLSL